MVANKNIYLDHNGNLHGITQKELVADLTTRMKGMDWYFDYSDDATVRNRGADELGKINRGLRLLAFSNGGGELAGRLWEKYAPEKFAMSRYLYQAAITERQQTINRDPNPVVTLINSLQARLNQPELKSDREYLKMGKEVESDLYRLAEYRGRELQAVRLYHSSTYRVDNSFPGFLKKHQHLLTMNEKVLGHAEGQLKRIGMQESNTGSLKEAMMRGEEAIKHPYQKTYEREIVNKEGEKQTVKDTVNIEQHWKKSSQNNYFLNKVDAELKKDGTEKSVKQTFYLTDGRKHNINGEAKTKELPQVKFTLKEMFNLLAGRPVLKEFLPKDLKEMYSWFKLNFREQLPNGNYKMNSYHQNYGFKLEDTLRQYPIQDLLNPEYRQRLMKSLERGNLQKVTMIGKDKKLEPVLITPSITTGSLKLYAMDGKLIALDAQVQKEWVTKDFANELKLRFENRNKLTAKQEGSKPKQNLGQRLTKMFRRRP